MAGMAGLNIGALPMNPALVAAALNQAGWSLMGNLQQGGQGGPAGGPGAEHGAFPTPTSFPATVTPGGPGQPHAGVTTMASSAPQGNGSAGFLGWGASPPGEPPPHGAALTPATQASRCPAPPSPRPRLLTAPLLLLLPELGATSPGIGKVSPSSRVLLYPLLPLHQSLRRRMEVRHVGPGLTTPALAAETE